MESKKVYSLFYLLLLTITAPMLAVARSEDKRDVDDERRQIAVAPLAVYAGVAVSPWVWAAILAAYGIAELTKYNVSKTSSDSHSCANNRGWCRSSCFSHEYIDSWNSAVCGNYDCCRPL
ncbi:big defensin-like [Mya arenaria]|uniref:big defensin-like n=1 Tax=Mya arenaria TaxID=6604 RepID=UPI0022E528AC|nr:big defensin-like [Mya arenaria]